MTVFIDSVTVPPLPPDEEYYLSLALKRSDVIALEENVSYYRYGIRVAQSGQYPFLNLLGNYYTQRTGLLSDIKWDVTLGLDVPLYEGGLSPRKCAKRVRCCGKPSCSCSVSGAWPSRKFPQAYAMLDSSMRQVVRRMAIASEKARRVSYDAQARDYRYGIGRQFAGVAVDERHAKRHLQLRHRRGAGQTQLSEAQMRERGSSVTLSDISIKNPVFAWMLMAALILFGWVGFRGMGIQPAARRGFSACDA